MNSNRLSSYCVHRRGRDFAGRGDPKECKISVALYQVGPRHTPDPIYPFYPSYPFYLIYPFYPIYSF